KNFDGAFTYVSEVGVTGEKNTDVVDTEEGCNGDIGVVRCVVKKVVVKARDNKNFDGAFTYVSEVGVTGEKNTDVVDTEEGCNGDIGVVRCVVKKVVVKARDSKFYMV
nr:hypothetical protein [Tanacetum cinerariifolium]